MEEMLSISPEWLSGGGMTIYAYIFAFLWLVAFVASFGYRHKIKNYWVYQGVTFVIMLLGAGVFWAANLWTLFICFEGMSLLSVLWVYQKGNDAARVAGKTYLVASVMGGLSILFGMMLYYAQVGDLSIASLSQAFTQEVDSNKLLAAGMFMFIGFAVKAGCFPLQGWAKDAYPAAPAYASALLSGALSKTGIYGMYLVVVVFIGNAKTLGGVADSIAWTVFGLGVLTIFVGALPAIASVDYFDLLAHSSISQMGFMVMGIALISLSPESEFAAMGMFLFMLHHSLSKLLMFLIGQELETIAGSSQIANLQGIGTKKYGLHVRYLLGVLGMSAFPGTIGYLAKTMIHEATIYDTGMEIVFLVAGSTTLVYMLKFYVAIFWEKKEKGSEEILRSKKAPITQVILWIPALMIVGIGMFPVQVLEFILPQVETFLQVKQEVFMESSFYQISSLRGSFYSIGMGVFFYFIFVIGILSYRNQGRVYRDLWPKWLHVEWLLYRPVFAYALPAVGIFFARIVDTFLDRCIWILRKTVYRDSQIPHELPEGTIVTQFAGNTWDKLCAFAGRKLHVKVRRGMVSTAHRLAVIREEWMENSHIISRSLSYGLLMFALGLCATLLFLLFWKG